jgi:hypothetical protein
VDGIAGIGESVMRKPRVARHLDQSHAPQIGEMPGDRWLRESQNVDDVADAQLPSGEDAQDADASGIGEALEDGIEITNLRGGKRSQEDLRIIFVCANYICVDEYMPATKIRKPASDQAGHRPPCC